MTRLGEPQNLAVLRQAEGGVPASELCHEHSMGRASLLQVAREVWWYGCDHD